MDAIELLLHQHREIERLFERYEAAENKRAHFERLADLLSVHIALDEEVFYPATAGVRTADEQQEVLVAREQAKRLVSDMLELDPVAPDFEVGFGVLRELVDRHVEQEESESFPTVRESFGDSGLKALSHEVSRVAGEFEEGDSPRAFLMASMRMA